MIGAMTFYRYRDTVTGREIKAGTTQAYHGAEQFQQWFTDHIRNATLLEACPWDEATHGRGIWYPIPRQNVRFDTRNPIVYAPDPRRRSVLIQPRAIARPILKGA